MRVPVCVAYATGRGTQAGGKVAKNRAQYRPLSRLEHEIAWNGRSKRLFHHEVHEEHEGLDHEALRKHQHVAALSCQEDRLGVVGAGVQGLSD